MIRPHTTVLFDIDGTLLSSSGAGLRALERAMVDIHGIAHAMDGVSLAGRTDRSIVRDLIAAHRLSAGIEAENTILEGYLGHLPEQLSTAATLLPGIVRLLEHLAEQKDIAIGLLTGNIRRGAAVKLGHVAREAVESRRDRHGADYPTDRVLVIGDTPLDIRCARAVGARVLAVATGIHAVHELAPHAPDHLMADLSNYDSVLELLRP